MIALDGTPGKSRIGANAILGVSCATARAVANSRRIPLWQYLQRSGQPTLPVPMVNILSGGLHAGRNFEFQDFLVIPRNFESLDAALEAIVTVHRATAKLLAEEGYLLTGVADEGGWGPRLATNEMALGVLTRAIGQAGYRAGVDFSIAIDV